MKGPPPKISKDDAKKLKGALRRAFARSDIHSLVLARVTVEHADPRNPRCEYWGYCESCGVVQPRWRLTVDHVTPVVPVTSALERMSIYEMVDAIWCDLDNLQALCPQCHSAKTKAENAARRLAKKRAA
jgi:hypothetical protein